VEVDSLLTMAEVARAALPELDDRSITALGGPSFAAEVAAELPTAVVVAGPDRAVVGKLQSWLSSPKFRVYASDDRIGVELGGALKNVIALAAGINDGAGLGNNARAAVITRGLTEVTRLAVALGAKPATLAGLAGMGDLVLTCTGALSRNRRVGLELGRGRPLAEILAEVGMVAEGVLNTRSAYQLGQREQVDLPIVETMHEILYAGLSVERAIEALLRRALRAETDGSGAAIE
jgi:glycerol-3-phosphate dehydrogenase (NAD(P)+)